MNVRSVFHLISFLVLFIAVAIGLAGVVGFVSGDSTAAVQGLFLSSGIAMLLGGVLWFFTRGKVDLSRKDGFAIVTFGWLVVGLVGAIPYLMTGSIPNPVDAVFETLSGFTTTGSTILADIEILPRGVIFWRSLTQWLGGMGVVLLCVAILPFLGVGGMQIYRAEMPGPSKDRLTPRIANTAKLLYGVYVMMTLVQIILLMLAGMGWFDAINHSFCTVSTGGFSPYNRSIAAFESSWIHFILTVFMLLAGINFALHYRFVRGDTRVYFKSPETRAYLMTVLLIGLLIAWDVGRHRDGTVWLTLRDAFFQTASVLTTTGFVTADYESWPLLSKSLVFLLLFLGGCAGSTAGGLKTVRCMVVIKEIIRQIRLFMQPQAVLKVRLGPQSVAPPIVAAITAFVLCYFLLIVVFSLVMALLVSDARTAATSVITCISNVGPGFGWVGPTENFAKLPQTAKVLLSFCMVLGRLELFTVLVLFSPRFWKH